jgi:probable FeS assembly SUF system protein SufT
VGKVLALKIVNYVSENMQEIIILRRDCDAFLIPSGARIYLPMATEVTITQALGGSYTVNVYGNLARVDAKDADALGKESKSVLEDLPPDASLEDKIWAQLKTCFDPEIPVNIVDLGLIYDCLISEVENDKKTVSIKMTLTAPGCGMGPVLAADVKQKILMIPDVIETNVDVVFDPPWEQSKMSDAAKLQLGML